MSTTEHTPGAVKAAKGIWKDGKITLHADTDYNAFIESTTTIIDRETGLPTLRSRIEELEADEVVSRKAHRMTIATLCDVVLKRGEDEEIIKRLEDEKVELVAILKRLVAWGKTGVGISICMTDILKDTRAALSKHTPEQGGEQTNPKPEV